MTRRTRAYNTANGSRIPSLGNTYQPNTENLHDLASCTRRRVSLALKHPRLSLDLCSKPLRPANATRRSKHHQSSSPSAAQIDYTVQHDNSAPMLSTKNQTRAVQQSPRWHLLPVLLIALTLMAMACDDAKSQKAQRPGSSATPTPAARSGTIQAPAFDPDRRQGFPQTLTFGIVPQQPAAVIKANWQPLASRLSKLTGNTILVKTATTIPEFERRLAAGHYDLSYMNPYHYTVFKERPGYTAFARQKDKRIKGILVVRKDSKAKTLQDCAGLKAAFPSPAAFAASLLTRAKLKQLGVAIATHYVNSHDSVYAAVAGGIHGLGGGVKRTFATTPEHIRSQLRVLWTTPGYTPHAFAYHPRVPQAVIARLQAAISTLFKQPRNAKAFDRIKFKGLMPAVDKDWNDVRSLGLKELAHFATKPTKEP